LLSGVLKSSNTKNDNLYILFFLFNAPLELYLISLSRSLNHALLQAKKSLRRAGSM